MTYAEKLAEYIKSERLAELQEEYYEQVNQETYERWFGTGERGKRPHLYAKRHGGIKADVYYDDGTQEVQYYMLRRKYYSMRRHYYGKPDEKGRRKYKYKPDGTQLYRTQREATKMMDNVSQKKIVIKKDYTSVYVSLPYKRNVAQYRHSETFSAFLNDFQQDEFRSIRKDGSFSEIDRLIMNAIRKWAKYNGITCLLEGKGEDDR